MNTAQLRRIERASKVTAGAAWAVATGLLASSTVTGANLLAEQGFHPDAAWSLELSIDAGVAVGLYGEQVLAGHGIACRWGSALRWTSAGASLVLNTLGPVLDNRPVAAGLHTVAPVMLAVALEAAVVLGKKLAQLRERIYAMWPAPETESVRSEQVTIDQISRTNADRTKVQKSHKDQTRVRVPKGQEFTPAQLTAGRDVQDLLALNGQQLTRRALISGLRDRGVSCGTNRAGELLSFLRSEHQLPRTNAIDLMTADRTSVSQ